MTFPMLAPIRPHAIAVLAAATCFAAPLSPANEETAPADIFRVEEAAWGPLNPARGDASPQAADLWGNRGVDQATGFLVRFKDGFSSPPHIHNVTYRGVVIEGLVHNDDPDAEPLWMPTGSYWTQPAGEPHITAARGREDGADSLVYIEIQAGPYLVKPEDEAFDNGERPINVDASNVMWLDATDLRRIGPAGDDRGDPGESGPAVAFLWGNPNGAEAGGSLLKLPPGFVGTVHTGPSSAQAVVICGEVQLPGAESATRPSLAPGSHTSLASETAHAFSTETGCVMYLRTASPYQVRSAADEG